MVTVEYVVINIGVQTVLAVGIAMLMYRLTQSITVRGGDPAAVPGRERRRRAGLVLDARLPGRHREQWPDAGSGSTRSRSSATRHWAIPTIARINVWRHMGYTALLVFAGLQTIPKYVYEAAELDGVDRVEDVLADHAAAAAARAGAGPGGHHDRLVPDLRHRRGDHAGRPGQRDPGHLLLHLRAGVHPVRLRVRLRDGGGAVRVLAVVSLLQLRLLRAKESDLA